MVAIIAIFFTVVASVISYENDKELKNSNAPKIYEYTDTNTYKRETTATVVECKAKTLESFEVTTTMLETTITQIETEISTTTEFIETENVVIKEYSVPQIDSSFKSYMDYTKITNTNSKQYEFQIAATTNEDGLRCYNGYPMVALGTYYTNNVGDMFNITLDTGNVFTIVIGDVKRDCDTNDNHMYLERYNETANVVEFIVDTNMLRNDVRTSGDINTYDFYSGNITNIERISNE